MTIDFSAGMSAGGTYSGAGTKQCSNLYCHGPATVDWDLPTVVVCGSCHGDGAGRPTAPVSGGSHQTGSHVVACNNCHEHNGGAVAGHVDGPTSAGVADATVSNAGLSVTSYTVGASLGTDTDGFNYSAGSCPPTCHSTGTWGGTGGCDFCHGYPPNGSNGSTNHLAANRRSNGGAARGQTRSSSRTTPSATVCHGMAATARTPPWPPTTAPRWTRFRRGGDAYVVANNHNRGSATMNGDTPDAGPNTAYNESTGGCGNACHGANYTLNTRGPRRWNCWNSARARATPATLPAAAVRRWCGPRATAASAPGRSTGPT